MFGAQNIDEEICRVLQFALTVHSPTAPYILILLSPTLYHRNKWLTTNSLEQSPSWEANRFSAFYGTRSFITTFTSQPPVPVLNQINPVFLPSSILILSSHLHLGLPSRFFSSGFHAKSPYAPLLSPIRAAYPTYLILLDLITQLIFGDAYRILSFSLCSLVHSPVTSSLLEPSKLLRCYLTHLNKCGPNLRQLIHAPSWRLFLHLEWQT